MSETASTRSNDGTATDCNDASLDDVRLSHRGLRARLAPNGATSALTKDNLEKNDSVLANHVRLYQAQGKVDGIAAAVLNGSDDQLPEGTKRQLLEDMSGVSPMQRFLKTVDDRTGGPVNVEAWNDLVVHDALAADLGSM